MKVPNIVIYETIQKHIDGLCAFYGIGREKIQLMVSEDVVNLLASLPNYLVPDLAGFMLKEGCPEGIKKHFEVEEVTVTSETEDFSVNVLHSAGYLLIKKILDKVLHSIQTKEYKVLLSAKGADLVDAMELWEAKEYTNPDKTPITGGLAYLTAWSMQSWYGCPDRTLFKLEIVDSQEFLYKIEESPFVLGEVPSELINKLTDLGEEA